MPRRIGIVVRIVRWLAGLAAGILIVLALLVGVARLLLPMAPEYQEEIRRFAMEATGLDIRFANLSATWPIAGPEVRFHDVRVSTREEGRRVLDARELRVGVNLFQVLTEGRLAPGRFRLVGSRIRAERTADGQVLVNGVPLEELLRQPPSDRLPRVDVRVEEVQLSLADPARLVPELAAHVRELALEIRRDGVAFDGEILPAGGLGRTLALSGRIPAALLPGPGDPDRQIPAGADWFVEAAGSDLDLAGWLRLLANEDWPLVAGRGDLQLRADFRGRSPMKLDLDLRAGGLSIREEGDAALTLDQLDAVLRWQADAEGWSLELERLAARQGPGPARVSRGQARYGKAGDQAVGLSVSGPELHPGDIYPLVRALASAELRRSTLPESVAGTLRDLQLDARWGGGTPAAWQVRVALEEAGVSLPAPGMAVTGVTGRLEATEASGRLDLASTTALVLRLPKLLRKDLVLTSARGPLGWRTGPEGLEVVGDDLRLTAAEGQARGRVQVRFPPGGSPVVDLTARAQADSVRAALEWLPLQKFKPNVVAWLDRAVVAGKVPRAEVVWQGSLRGFPYREGDGQFQVRFSVTDGVLDYASEWPRAENLSAEVLVDRWMLSSAENRATLAGVAVANAQVRVPDLGRDPTVEITAEQTLTAGPLLNFLRRSPVARMLGPTLANVTASGQLVGDLRLSVPLARLPDTRVDGRFAVDRATLGLRGVEFGLTALKGVVELDTTRLRAEEITGRFLDEPVEIALRPADSVEEGVSHVAVIRGRTPVAKLTSAFSLPYPERLAGDTGWEAVAEIPDRQNLQPLRIRIASDLDGLVSTLPVPLGKPAGVPEPLSLEVRLPERNRLEVDGRIARGASWALRFESGPGPGWRLERGSLRNGLPVATLPSQPGLTIGGRFRELRFEDWFPAGDGGADGGSRGGQIREITADVEAFGAIGRIFRQVRLDAERTRDAWNVSIRSERASGRITVPLADGNAPVNAAMERLWLVEDEPAREGAAPDSDPRRVPALNIRVDDFALGDMRLGRLEAEVVQRGDGVVVEPLQVSGRGFRITGNALWVVTEGDPARQRSELALKLASSNLAATLAALGYEQVMEGRQGDVALDLVWPGGPRKDFLSVAAGRVTLSLTDGQFLAVEPGSGRILGLLSVAALPRRLGLDFRDVLDEGLAFDKVKGEFRLDNGTAITCNLGLEGPVADLGMVGRVGLVDRSYDQIAVARPHVSDVLVLGGAVVGGPVLGGAVLLISQIFRKPLSSLGENYYTVTGSWDKPVVNKVQRSDVDVTPFKDCERYLAEALREIPVGVDTER